MILEFVLGMGIAAAHARRLVLPAPLRLALYGLAAVALGAGAIAGYVPGLPDQPLAVPRWLGWGLPCCALCAAAILKNAKADGHAALERTGDASYSLYLLHPLVIIGLRPLLSALQSLGLPPTLAALLHVSCVVAFALALARVIFRNVERPVTRALARRIDRVKPLPSWAISP